MGRGNKCGVEPLPASSGDAASKTCGDAPMRSLQRCAASLLELLISLAIIGGLAAMTLSAAMMLLNAAYRLGQS